MELSEWVFEDEPHQDEVMNTFVLNARYLERPIRFCFFITGLAGFYRVRADPDIVLRRMTGDLDRLQRIAILAFDAVYGQRVSKSYFITQVMMEGLLGQHSEPCSPDAAAPDAHTGDAARPPNAAFRR